MLTLFWDEKGVILEHYTPRGTTVTSASYSDLLTNHLWPAVKSKRCGLLSSGVLLQHDNARSHTAHTTVATITDLHFDFHTFGPLKEAMGRKKFHSDEEVRHAVHEWLRGLPKEFFSKGIYALCKCWRTCIERGGDYVEK